MWLGYPPSHNDDGQVRSHHNSQSTDEALVARTGKIEVADDEVVMKRGYSYHPGIHVIRDVDVIAFFLGSVIGIDHIVVLEPRASDDDDLGHALAPLARVSC